MHRTINFYIGALVITIVGSIATLLITQTASHVAEFVYDEQYFAPETGSVKTP